MIFDLFAAHRMPASVLLLDAGSGYDEVLCPSAGHRDSMPLFESTYLKYRDVVLRFAIQCAGRREVAEELTAEAFLELHRHWDSIDIERLPSWLFTVVKNRAADYWRRQELERRYRISEPKPVEMPKQEESPELFENSALKPVHRMCLTLRYVHELSLTEIAGRLGLKEVQVKGHLQYARTLLRKQLSAGARPWM